MIFYTFSKIMKVGNLFRHMTPLATATQFPVMKQDLLVALEQIFHYCTNGFC